MQQNINDIKNEKYDWASSLEEPVKTAWLDFYDRFFDTTECEILYQKIVDGTIVPKY